MISLGLQLSNDPQLEEICRGYFYCGFEELKIRAKKFKEQKCIITEKPTNNPVRISALTEQGHITLSSVYFKDALEQHGISDSTCPLITKYCTYGETVYAEDVLENNERIWSTFERAIKNDDPEPIKLWHQAGGEKNPLLIDLTEPNTGDIFTPIFHKSLLCSAIDSGKIKLSLYLIEQCWKSDELNYDIDSIIDSLGDTDAMIITEALLRRGADVNKGSVCSPLTRAVMTGNVEYVKLLLEYGAIVDTPNDSPLIAAAFRNHTEIAELLLKYLAKVNQSSSFYEGKTALTVAAQMKHSEMVKLLLKHGAKLTRQQKVFAGTEAVKLVEEVRSDYISHNYDLRKRKDRENELLSKPSSSASGVSPSQKKRRFN